MQALGCLICSRAHPFAKPSNPILFRFGESSLPMDRQNSPDRARTFIREYEEENTQMIRAWLEGAGTLEEVGAGFARLECPWKYFSLYPFRSWANTSKGCA